MKTLLQTGILVSVLCLAGCATSAIKQTLKSPEYQGGPVKKVAVIGVDERGLVRQGFENRFVRELRARGQEAVVTHDLMGLPEIKADKAAAASRLKGAGADAVLIIRLVDKVSYDRQVRATAERQVESITGMDDYYGWYNYYEVAYTDFGVVWSSSEQKVFLDSSLFELGKGSRVWSAVTLTTLKDKTDRLVAVDDLVAEVVRAMGKDGVTK